MAYQILSKSVESSLIHDDYRHVQNLMQIEQYATKNLFSIWGPFAIFRFFLTMATPPFQQFLRDQVLSDSGKLKHKCVKFEVRSFNRLANKFRGSRDSPRHFLKKLRDPLRAVPGNTCVKNRSP